LCFFGHLFLGVFTFPLLISSVISGLCVCVCVCVYVSRLVMSDSLRPRGL